MLDEAVKGVRKPATISGSGVEHYPRPTWQGTWPGAFGEPAALGELGVSFGSVPVQTAATFMYPGCKRSGGMFPLRITVHEIGNGREPAPARLSIGGLAS